MRGLTTIVTSSTPEAEAILRWHSTGLVFCSHELPGERVDDFIRENSLRPTKVPVVVALHPGERGSCVHFLDAGALDCVVYPLSVVEIGRITQNVLSLVQPQGARQPTAGAA